MTLAYWCILIAGLLPYAAIAMAKADRSYLKANDDPRAWEARLTGRPARAHNAHLNSFEAFPLIAAGVIVGSLAGAPKGALDVIAIAFVVTRIAYIACYLADRATLRSLVWMLGLGLAIAPFFLAAGAR